MKVTLYVQYEDQIVDTEKEHKERIDSDFEESMNGWDDQFEQYLANNYSCREVFDMDDKEKKSAKEDFRKEFARKYDDMNCWYEVEKEI